MLPKIAVLVVLSILQLPLGRAQQPQDCLSKQQVAGTLRQVQKLLSSHEAAQIQNLRNFKKQLMVLQSTVLKQGSKRNETCLLPLPPSNGRRLGKKVAVGHEVHFVCDPGFQLTGSETRMCLENRTWSGQPASCKNVDECHLFQSGRHTRICLHECVNLPGSYRCVCPDGYRLQADQNTCNDVDECAENQHNCSRGQTCVNVFGGFRCVRPECPKAHLNTTYVKTSPLQCERSPCPMDSSACPRAAHSISFHYLPLPSNRSVPRVLFKMSTSRFVGDSLRFAILGGNGQGKLVVQRSDQHTGELVVTRPLVGPMTLEVDLEMSEFARKVLLGKHIFKITVFVSQYEF